MLSRNHATWVTRSLSLLTLLAALLMLLPAAPAEAAVPGVELVKLDEIQGEIFDADSSRILYKTADQTLQIKDRTSGEITTIVSGKATELGYLIPGGALFTEPSDSSQEPLYEWREGRLTELGTIRTGHVPSLNVDGNYAIYTNQEAQLMLRNLETGASTQINFYDMGQYNDVTNQGDVALWGYNLNGEYTSSSNVFLYKNGSTTQVTEDPNFNFTSPVTDGDSILYIKKPLDCCSNSSTVLYQNGQETILDPSSSIHTPHLDYEINNGWVAYTKWVGATRQAWLRSPQGEEKQVTSFKDSVQISKLGENGELLLQTGSQLEKLYWTDFQTSMPVLIGSSEGKRMYKGGSFYHITGGQLYQIKPKSADSAPVWPAADPLSVSGVTEGSAVLTWLPAADGAIVTSYHIYRDGQLLETVPGTQTSYSVTGLTPKTTYSFAVAAENSNGNQSTLTNSVSVVTSGTAAAKLNLLEPLDQSVITDTKAHLVLEAAASFPDPQILASLYEAENHIITFEGSGTAETWVDVSEYNGRTLTLRAVITNDPANSEMENSEKEFTLHVEHNPKLLPELTISGLDSYRIVAYDESRIFAESGSEVVQIQRSDGTKTVIPGLTVGGYYAPNYHITPTGLIINNFNPGDRDNDYFWNGTELQPLADSAELAFFSKGNYALYQNGDDRYRHEWILLNTADGTTRRFSMNDFQEAYLEDQGNFIFVQGDQILRYHADTGTNEIIATGQEGAEKLSSDGSLILFTKKGTLYSHDGQQSTVIASNYPTDYKTAGGWIAYSKTFNQFYSKAFLRSPQGEISSPEGEYYLHTLTPQGQLMLDGKDGYYLYEGNQLSEPLTAGYGTIKLIDGQWYKGLGRSLFRLQTTDAEQDTAAPVWTSPEALTVTNVTYSSAELHWLQASDDTAVTAYEIYSGSELLDTVSGSVYQYTATGLTPATAYEFTLRALDAAGNASIGNPSVSVTTAVYEPQPSTGTITLQQKSGFLDVGSVVEVRIKAENAADLYAFLLKLQYDHSWLKLTEAKLHSDFGKEKSTAIFAAGNLQAETVGMTGSLLGSTPGKTGTTGLVVLKFTALQTGTADVTLTSTSQADSQGRVTPGTQPVSLSVRIGGGDLDQDGKIGLSDLVLISRLNGTTSGQPGFNPAYDLNNDAKIDSADVQFIAQKVTKEA